MHCLRDSEWRSQELTFGDWKGIRMDMLTQGYDLPRLSVPLPKHCHVGQIITVFSSSGFFWNPVFLILRTHNDFTLVSYFTSFKAFIHDLSHVCRPTTVGLGSAGTQEIKAQWCAPTHAEQVQKTKRPFLLIPTLFSFCYKLPQMAGKCELSQITLLKFYSFVSVAAPFLPL